MKNLYACLCVSIVLLISCSAPETAPPQPSYPIPSPAQLAWHKMEMNAFVHFTINTFTDREWGYGDESESLFNPTSVDVDQWVTTIKDTGFKGIILTCKHHDGFCLWPSKYTEHSIKNSPYKNGNGDIVGELSAACKKQRLKFGIYLSPWDRNHAQYGTDEYITYYRNQLKELFTNYGPAFEMWFDGANGGDGYYGGKNETRKINGATYYDWPTTLNLVREMEPNIIFFSDAGPGVRWVGNEKGLAGETNWNSITPDTLYAGKAGIEKLLQTGSENGTHWIPAEVDVSIRPGWFYHAKEDSLVKSGEQLFEIYLTSVGRGSTLLLNIPPDRRGLIHEHDVAALGEFRKILNTEFKTNYAEHGNVTVDSYRGNDNSYSGINLIDDIDSTYWATDDNVSHGSIEIELPEEVTLKYVVLQEYIPFGQRIKQFDVEVWKNNGWLKIAEGSTIGYKRIVKVEPTKTKRVRINIRDSKACLVMKGVELY